MPELKLIRSSARGEYHETYRREFLDEDARKGKFEHEPASGSTDLDKTSFVEAQKKWGESPKTWKHFVDKNGRRVFEPKTRPKDVPGFDDEYHWWYHHGVVLLDQDNHPLREIPGLNRTLSSALEGWRIDALRKLFPKLMVTEYV